MNIAKGLFSANTEELDTVRAALAEVTQEKLRLQDRMDGVLEDRKQLWAALCLAQDREREAYQMLLNICMQKQGAGIPYPEVHHLDPATLPKSEPGPVGRKGRLLPSEIVRGETLKALEKLYGA